MLQLQLTYGYSKHKHHLCNTTSDFNIPIVRMNSQQVTEGALQIEYVDFAECKPPPYAISYWYEMHASLSQLSPAMRIALRDSTTDQSTKAVMSAIIKNMWREAFSHQRAIMMQLIAETQEEGHPCNTKKLNALQRSLLEC